MNTTKDSRYIDWLIASIPTKGIEISKYGIFWRGKRYIFAIKRVRYPYKFFTRYYHHMGENGKPVYKRQLKIPVHIVIGKRKFNRLKFY
jgi:hypothetical protein